MSDHLAPLTEMELRAIDNGVRYCGSRFDYRLPREDGRQIGALRVLELRDKIAEVPEERRLAWLGWRVATAIRDAMRKALCQDGGTRDAPAPRVVAAEDARVALEDGHHNDTPEAQLAVKQALEAIARMPEPLPTIATLAMAGCSGAHIARSVSLSEARVSQLRSRLASQLLPYLGKAA